MASVDELLDALIKDCKKPEDIVGENGLLKQLTKRVLERAMQVERVWNEAVSFRDRRS